jgi:hypothetical protein
MLAHLGAPNQLFHTPAGTAFADIPVNEHRETWPIRSKRFCSWLRRCHYESTGEAASPAAIRSALDLLEARAQFDGRERAVHIRTAEHAGRIYRPRRRALACGRNRTRRLAGSWVPAGALPPAGRDITAASPRTRRVVLNLPSPNDFVLIVAWLLGACSPEISLPACHWRQLRPCGSSLPTLRLTFGPAFS